MGVKDWIVDKLSEDEPIVEKTTRLLEMATSNTSSMILESKTMKEKIAAYFKLYEYDDFTFQLVNFLASRVGHTYMFAGDKGIVKKLYKWADLVNLGNKLEDICIDSIVAGTSWIEPVMTTKTIQRIVIINPETMDFIRNTENQTIYDDEGKPLGYEQDVGTRKRFWKRDIITQHNQIVYTAKGDEDLRDRIKYLKICGRGDSALGTSLIAPGYRSAIIRANIADMSGEAAFRGGGIEATYTGDMPAEIKRNLKKDLKGITARNILVHKENVKIGLLPIPDTSTASDLMYQLADFQASGMGIPSDLMISGGKGYQQDLVSKIANMETRIGSYQQRLAEEVNDKIIFPLLILWGKPASAKIRFISASPSAQLNRARVISTLARRNLMTYDPEMEVALRTELELPHKLLDKQLEDWIKNGPPKVNPVEVGKETNVIDHKNDQDVDNKDQKVAKDEKDNKAKKDKD